MDINSFKLVPLVERQDLGEKCIELLNEEWPRSYAARENSQKKSCRPSPPMSFLLLETSTDRLIGHARVCLLPNRPNGCWVESVIVSRSERGKGLGKLLMDLLEDACRTFSFTEAYLSTEDKVEFYRRCGYEECAPILHSTSATSVFPIFEQLSFVPPPVVPSVSSSPSPTPNGMPPPPPPPPTMTQKAVSKGISTIDHQYMKKSLL